MEYRIVRLDTVDSTNTYAKAHFRELPDGSVISAKVQTAGRGRMGRRWVSGAGKDITATFIFKNIGRPFMAGAVTGVAAVEAMSAVCPEVSPFLKWPNDVYVRHFKLAGLLSEAVWEHGAMQCVVCGIGINVNSGSEVLSAAGQPAVSLFSLAGRRFDVDFLLDRLAKVVNGYYIMCQHYPREVFARWRGCNRLIGHAIEVTDPSGKRTTGLFRDVDGDGAMIFESGGVRRRFTCGDVRINASASDV
ncbi:MAG: biotin--[Lentisphaeria bacterium]|nr:biotin--[acetyl-CoA-carboxylase] ligase [Lentisphaeria bacterium]